MRLATLYLAGAIAAMLLGAAACPAPAASIPRADATPDAHWTPVVDPGFDAGSGGR